MVAWGDPAKWPGGMPHSLGASATRARHQCPGPGHGPRPWDDPTATPRPLRPFTLTLSPGCRDRGGPGFPHRPAEGPGCRRRWAGRGSSPPARPSIAPDRRGRVPEHRHRPPGSTFPTVKAHVMNASTRRPPTLEAVRCAFCHGKGVDPFAVMSGRPACGCCGGRGSVRVATPHVRCGRHAEGPAAPGPTAVRSAAEPGPSPHWPGRRGSVRRAEVTPTKPPAGCLARPAAVEASSPDRSSIPGALPRNLDRSPAPNRARRSVTVRPRVEVPAVKPRSARRGG